MVGAAGPPLGHRTQPPARPRRGGAGGTCKHQLPLCKSLGAAANANSPPSAAPTRTGRGICRPPPATLTEGPRPLPRLSSCNPFLQERKPGSRAMTGLKKKKFDFGTTLKNMEEFPHWRGLWKKKCRRSSRLKAHSVDILQKGLTPNQAKTRKL